MTADIVTLAARDPIFRLAAELRLHLSETDGRLMVNSREVARVFFHRRHRPLLRKIMEGMWNIPMRPDWEGQFRMLADGSVEMTAPALALALGGWGCRNKRVVQFHIDWVNLVCAKADEQEARTDVNFLTEGIKKFFPDLHSRYYTRDGVRCCDDCRCPNEPASMYCDEVWAKIATPDTYLCVACAKTRFDAYRRQRITLLPEGEGREHDGSR